MTVHEMSTEALAEEIEAINAIYGPTTLTLTSNSTAEADKTLTVLQIPEQPFSFILAFDGSYPDTPPTVRGTQTISGRGKGEGKWAVQVVEEALERVWRKGEVCMFDLIEEVIEALGKSEDKDTDHHNEDPTGQEDKGQVTDEVTMDDSHSYGEPPNWTTSDAVNEKKSVFIARCASTTTKEQAEHALYHLLSTNKKVASATHNITAWRMRTDSGTVVQDCDDDGETAAGGRLLHLMQLMDVWNVVVVVTGWYGGVKLGPDRFRIINAVARDALVKGGFVKGEEEKDTSKKKGKKGG